MSDIIGFNVGDVLEVDGLMGFDNKMVVRIRKIDGKYNSISWINLKTDEYGVSELTQWQMYRKLGWIKAVPYSNRGKYEKT